MSRILETRYERETFIKKWWFLIIFIMGVIIAGANLQANVQNLNSRVSADETKTEVLISTNSNVEVQLSQIQTDIQWIKQKLNK